MHYVHEKLCHCSLSFLRLHLVFVFMAGWHAYGANAVTNTNVISGGPANIRLLLTNASQLVFSKLRTNPQPFKITGIVTYYDLNWPLLFIQDDTGGLYVRGQTNAPVALSNKVELTGMISSNGAVELPKFKVLTKTGPWPLPKNVSAEELNSGKFDKRYLTARGKLFHISQERHIYVLHLLSPDNRTIRAAIIAASVPRRVLDGWLEAELALRGVCATAVNPDGVIQGYQLLIPGTNHIQVINLPIEKSFPTNKVKIATAKLMAPTQTSLKHILVEGVVTWRENPSTIYLQDETGGMSVHLRQPLNLNPGTRVEVAGLPAGDYYGFYLDRAMIRIKATNSPPAPKVVPAYTVMSSNLWATLISVSGYVINSSTNTPEPQWILQSGGTVFSVTKAGALPSQTDPIMQPGNLVQCIGICLPKRNPDRIPTSFEINARTIADLRKVSDGSWISIKQVLSLLGGVTLLALVVGAWALTLRYQVRRQTQQLRAQLDREIALEEQLRQAQKMEAIGQLAGGVAHDFNNMLTVIKGHLSLLAEDYQDRPAARHSLQEAGAATDRATNLTRQLLAFSRRQMLQIVVLDLNEVLTNVSSMLRRLIGEPIHLQLELSSEALLLEADAGMLDQVAMNLAVNARDAMPKGGRLILRTEVVTVERSGMQRNPEAQLGRFACWSVIDNGCGMDAQTLKRVFDPFFTTKGVGKGTGLGLSMVYGIVKQHNGWIEVNSEVGKGTTFKIYFPLTSKPSSARKGDVASVKVKGGTETVLVVEDDPAVRQLAVRYLRQYGYLVLEAANGIEALRLWEKSHDQIHLLLTDMVMPEGMSGQELAARCQAARPKLKVIYFSGYSLAAITREVELVEGVNFVAKPFEPMDLLKTVRECLDRNIT